jgi:hypothetical protein
MFCAHTLPFCKSKDMELVAAPWRTRGHGFGVQSRPNNGHRSASLLPESEAQAKRVPKRGVPGG